MTQGASDERARVREYLLAQAERYDFIDLWPRVVTARTELLRALDGVTQAQAEFAPAQGEWSILEVASHALASSQDVMWLIESLAAGREATRSTEPGERPAPPSGGIDELRRRLVEHSVEFAALPLRLPSDPDPGRQAPHAFFGDLDARAWFLFQRVHDRDHAGQIERIRAADGYPAGTG